jgi:hypothetical protein
MRGAVSLMDMGVGRRLMAAAVVCAVLWLAVARVLGWL